MLTEEKSQKLFAIYQNSNSWKIISKFIIPSILVSLPLGLFVFVDQLMIIRLIPNNPKFASSNLFTDWDAIQSIVKSHPKIPIYGVADAVKLAITLSLPITLLLDVLPFLISTGTVAIYTRHLAQKNFNELKKIFNSSWWFSLLIGVISCVLLCLLAMGIPLLSSPQKNTFTELSENELKTYTNYLKQFNDLGVTYAVSYVQFIAISLIFSPIQATLSLLLRAESKTFLPIVSSVVANLLNIILDYVFLTQTGYGMNAAAVASVIGYISNLLILIGYLIYASQKNLLHFSYRDLRLRHTIEWKLFFKIIAISIPILLVSVFYSINITVFVPIFGKTLNEVSERLHATKGHLHYQNLFGCTQPVAILIFTGISGIFDGTRGINNFYFENLEISHRKIRKLFNLITITSIVYAFIMYTFVYLLADPFFYLLEVNADQKVFSEWLLIVTGELPTFSLAVPALAYIQSSKRNFISTIIAIVQVIVFLTVIFTTKNIVLSQHLEPSPQADEKMYTLAAIMQMTLIISSLLSSAITYAIGLFYVLIYDKRKRESARKALSLIHA